MTDPYQLFFKAKEMEKRARDLTEKEIVPGYPCGVTFGAAKCHRCNHFSHCEKYDASSLFLKAWQGYRDTESLLRNTTTDQETDLDLLAEVLLSIHIHPNSGFARDTVALWEAQYLWLKLHYRTKKADYLKKAQLCQGIRNAFVIAIK